MNSNFENNEDQIALLLQDASFYDGESENPIHQSMKLPLAIVKLATLCCSKSTLVAAKERNNTFSFSREEQARFARAIIAANRFLSSCSAPLLPLLHLTPRMLESFTLETSQLTTFKIEDKSIVQNTVDLVVVNSRGRKNRKKKKSSQLSPRDIPACTATHQTLLNTEKKLSFESFSIPLKAEMKLLIESIPKEYHTSVHALCQLFEDHLMSVREMNDITLQALNMRLYLAEQDRC
jgi:hypothetical protein